MGKILVKLVRFLKKVFLCKTYHIEMAFVAIILATTVILSGGGYIEWIGALAVLLTFGHASVAERLAEVQAAKSKDEVEVWCFYKLKRYYYAKEILWLAYFILLNAWSALVGVFIFLLYGPWRKLWRKHNPRKEML